MKIAICDDSPVQIKLIRGFIKKYLQTHTDMFVDVTEYTSANQLLASLDRSKDNWPNVLILDIMMPGIGGIDAAKMLRRSGADFDIVFMTSTNDFAVDAFEVGAVHYLIKPITQKQFDDAIDRVVPKYSSKNLMQITCHGGVYNINPVDLVLMETMKNYVFLHCANGEALKKRTTLSDFYEVFKDLDYMEKCGASFIINLKHVKVVSGDTIVMDNGMEVHIPRRSLKSFHNAYDEFAKKYILAD